MALDDSYTKILLHMDGADASTTFTDESGKTFTRYGNAQIDTAQSVFGGASGLFDGTGDYISTPAHADLQFGTGDFTIDLRIKFNGTWGSTPGTLLFSSETTGNISLSIDSTNIALGRTNVAVDASFAHGMSLNTWYHIAVARSGNSVRSFVNGTQVGSTYDATGKSYGIVTGTGVIAGHSAAYYLNGWIDEHRVSKGIARWTANFTPPTRAYGTPAFTSEIMWFM